MSSSTAATGFAESSAEHFVNGHSAAALGSPPTQPSLAQLLAHAQSPSRTTALAAELAPLVAAAAATAADPTVARKFATTLFQANFGVACATLATEKAGHEDLVARTRAERDIVHAARLARPLYATLGENIALPKGIKGGLFWLLVVLGFVLGAADIYNAARYVVVFTPGRSWLLACIAVSPIAAIVVALKFMFSKLGASRLAQCVRGGGAVLAVGSGFVWVALLTINFGGVYGRGYTPLGLGWQKALLTAQTLAAISLSVLLVAAISHLLERKGEIKEDPERVHLGKREQELDQVIDAAAYLASLADGRLNELNASSETLQLFAEQKFVAARSIEAKAAEARSILDNRFSR